jgi:hypothetical protein
MTAMLALPETEACSLARVTVALVLVLVDLADDLLEEILDRHDARDAAVLVHDDRHPEVPPLNRAAAGDLRVRDEVRLCIRSAIDRLASERSPGRSLRRDAHDGVHDPRTTGMGEYFDSTKRS